MDRLELLHNETPVSTLADQDRWFVLGFEIALLHELIDDMNAAYAELEDQTLDHAFNAMD